MVVFSEFPTALVFIVAGGQLLSCSFRQLAPACLKANPGGFDLKDVCPQLRLWYGRCKCRARQTGKCQKQDYQEQAGSTPIGVLDGHNLILRRSDASVLLAEVIGEDEKIVEIYVSILVQIVDRVEERFVAADAKVIGEGEEVVKADCSIAVKVAR